MESVPYDVAGSRWLVDPQGVVSRYDVLYTTPSREPWEAMPTGGGDLSAMVRWDGSLHLHLTKTDAWGFQQPPDARPGNRCFNNVSPGHVRLDLGPVARGQGEERFRQRLDLYRGRVVVQIGEPGRGPLLAVWGHPTRRVLVVEISAPEGLPDPAAVVLSEWRETAKVGCADRRLYSREVEERPAAPHLANTGMQGYFGAGGDPLCGRGLAVAVAMQGLTPATAEVGSGEVRLDLPATSGPARFAVIIAAATTTAGDPVAAARRELEAALALPLDTLRDEQQAWWRESWSRSFLRLESPDRTAEWLTAAYHVHLYTLGCVGRGPYPPKWDGGPGLMRGDERTWGLSEWVQEIRFTYLPLYAANRLETAWGLTRHYSQMVPYLAAQTQRLWGLPGLWIPETTLPWGHAEDLVLRDQPGIPEYLARWDPQTAPYGRFERYNPYVIFLFTAGLEVCHHYLTYYRFTGDEAFLRQDAYPLLREVCRFVAGLFRQGPDGLYHLDPANALETWWLVRDPADTLAGVQAIFPEFIRLSEAYDLDADLRATCRELLDSLPPAPTGLWREDSVIEPEVDVYAPAAALGPVPNRVNAENPALYRVYPFGLSGLESPDYDRARRTFERRVCVLWHGWSLDAVWAARLGLAEEAGALLVQHARQFNRFRYGGWDSNDSNVLPDGLAAAPFLDAGGNSAFALQEMLLQSHGGTIRLAPAVPAAWSGVFQLRAEGGFLVAAEVRQGQVRFAEVRSLRGHECAVANPWDGALVVREDRTELARSTAPTVRFPTLPGATYTLEPADRPLAGWVATPLLDEPNRQPGLPGRD